MNVVKGDILVGGVNTAVLTINVHDRARLIVIRLSDTFISIHFTGAVRIWSEKSASEPGDRRTHVRYASIVNVHLHDRRWVCCRPVSARPDPEQASQLRSSRFHLVVVQSRKDEVRQ